jgi:hypothetical protein
MTGLNVVTLGLAILALVTHAGILFGVTRLTRQSFCCLHLQVAEFGATNTKRDEIVGGP